MRTDRVRCPEADGNRMTNAQMVQQDEVRLMVSSLISCCDASMKRLFLTCGLASRLSLLAPRCHLH